MDDRSRVNKNVHLTSTKLFAPIDHDDYDNKRWILI